MMFAIILHTYAVSGKSFLPTDYIQIIAGQCDNVLTLYLISRHKNSVSVLVLTEFSV